MKNKKSDVKAKAEFVKLLQTRGYKADVVSQPADIMAVKDGQTWYFEIKMTKRTDVYFGAATLTEWKQAIADPEHFRFVVAKTNDDETEFEFLEYTPEEFMDFSTIPPFKIYFNINFDGSQRNTKKATKLTPKSLTVMSECFDKLMKIPADADEIMNRRREYFSQRLGRSFEGETISRAVDRVIANQDRFYKLLRSTEEPGIEDMISAIHKSNFFSAHSHSHHHYPSGLAEHSLGVYDQLTRKAKNLDLAKKDIILAALLHDVCMAHSNEWAPFRGGHGRCSAKIVAHYLPKLSPRVIEAIRCHKHKPAPKDSSRNPLWALIVDADHADAATSPGTTLKFMK